MDIHAEIVRLVKHALFSASEAAHYASESSGISYDDPIRAVRFEAGAVDIALNGLSAIHTAKTLYLNAGEEDDILEDIFVRYEMFVHEITSNFVEDHSHQWTLIRKDELLKLAVCTEYDIKSAYEDE